MGGNGPHFGRRDTFLRLATMRQDGFAGAAPRSTAAPAALTSHPLRCGGEAPLISADVGAGGSVRIAVLAPAAEAAAATDEHNAAAPGAALRGRGLSESIALTASATRARAAWRDAGGGVATAAPIPETCVLQFELRNATLYTFGWVGDGSDEQGGGDAGGDAGGGEGVARADSGASSQPAPAPSRPAGQAAPATTGGDCYTELGVDSRLGEWCYQLVESELDRPCSYYFTCSSPCTTYFTAYKGRYRACASPSEGRTTCSAGTEALTVRPTPLCPRAATAATPKGQYSECADTRTEAWGAGAVSAAQCGQSWISFDRWS